MKKISSILNYETLKHQKLSDNFLFTKLRVEKEHYLIESQKILEQINIPGIDIKNSVENSNNHHQIIYLKGLEFELQLLKQNKAHEIAERHLKTGQSLHVIMKQIKDMLRKNIHSLVLQHRSNIGDSTKSQKQLGSTVRNSGTGKSIETPCFDANSIVRQEIKQFSAESKQFTLGNRKDKTTQSGNSYRSRKEFKKEVSQFTLNSKQSSISRKIKERIMNSNRNGKK